MISINYAELDDICLALKKFQDSLNFHLTGAKGALLDIYFTPLEMVECPQISMLEADMVKVQTQGTKAIDEIQELIAGIHKAINEFHDAEHKTAHDINAAMESSFLLGRIGNENIVSNGSILSKASVTTSKNVGTKKTDKTKSIDDFILAASTAGAVGATDKVISTASEKGLLGKTTNTVETGINRETRRKFNYPKTVEVDKPGVKLREEFGVVGVALATGIVIEDVKNNDTAGTRAGAIAIDGVATAGAYVATDYAAGVGAAFAVGAVEIATTAIGIVALPEIAVGAAAVVGAVVAVGIADYAISSAGSFFKEQWGLK